MDNRTSGPTVNELMIAFVPVIGIAVIATTINGCNSGVDTGQSTFEEMQQTEANHERLVVATPPPCLEESLERENLVRRLELFNNPDRVSYIYLLSHGQVLAFFPIKGKVSSVNSLLTTPNQIVSTWVGSRTNGHYESHVIASPDLDGSYGSNGSAVFFFLTDGTYCEWSGEYFLCTSPLPLTTPPLIVMEVEDRDQQQVETDY